MHDTRATVPQKYQNNPLFAKPPEDTKLIDPEQSALSSFFSDTPTSADFLNDSGAYEEKIATIRKQDTRRQEQSSLVPMDREATEKKRIIEKNSKYPTTPAQQKIENYLIESGADREDVESYLRYKNTPREKILKRSKVLTAFFDLLPEDVPVLEDFLVLAHRNNIGYAFTSPSEE